MTYREDASPIRARRLRENVSWRNRFTLSFSKQDFKRESTAMKRRRCGSKEQYPLEVLTAVKT